MPELQVPADWYDMSMVSNRLRQTYVNGFLDVSNVFTARQDANIVGTIRQSEEGMYDAPSYVGTNVDSLTVNESFTLDPDCVFTMTSSDISNTGVFNNDGSLNNTGVFNNDGSLNNAGDISNVGVFNNDGSFNNTGDIINNGRIINNGTLEITDNVLYTDVSFAGISDLSLNGFINLNGNMTINGNVGIGTTPESKLHVKGGPICIERTFSDTNQPTLEPGLVFMEDHSSSDCMYIAYDAGGTGGTDNEGVGIYSKSGGGANPTSGRQIMMMRADGNVGIGTSNPYAKLHINGYHSTGVVNMTTRNWIKYTTNSTAVQRSTNTTQGMSASIYASADIITNTHLISAAISVTSDRRIKQNIVDVDDGSALETLRLLKPKKYEYKDTFSKTQSVVWGFIAQEVAETLPYATHTGKKEIPNIYQVANVSNGNHLTFATDIQLEYDASGSLVNELLLYDASDNRIDVTIQELVSATEIRIESDTAVPNEVFVYGQKVDDFHYLNKQAIFTVATSALQEVDRQLQAEKAKTATLETQLADLIARVSALETA